MPGNKVLEAQGHLDKEKRGEKGQDSARDLRVSVKSERIELSFDVKLRILNVLRERSKNEISSRRMRYQVARADPTKVGKYEAFRFSTDVMALQNFTRGPVFRRSCLPGQRQVIDISRNMSSSRTHPSSKHPRQQRRFVIPAEWTPHSRTLMAWPTTRSLYPHQIEGARSEVLAIADAISKFEPVTLFAHRDDVRELKSRGLSEDVKIEGTGLVESQWVRDTGPIFVVGEMGEIEGVDFGFNAWGEKLASPDDYGLAARILDTIGVRRLTAGLVAEGGGVEVDGKGTLLACESSIVNDNRNPGMSRETIEQGLKYVLGVEKVIWLKGVKGADITDCHIDALARFVTPGTVVLSKPHSSRKDVWMEVYEDSRNVLETERDAEGRKLKIVEIQEPNLRRMEQEPEDGDEHDSVFSYVNYLVVNGGVIAPKFGDEMADRRSKDTLEKLFPGREIVQVHLNMLPRAGGGIHCATQQQPIGKARSNTPA